MNRWIGLLLFSWILVAAEPSTFAKSWIVIVGSYPSEQAAQKAKPPQGAFDLLSTDRFSGLKPGLTILVAGKHASREPALKQANDLAKSFPGTYVRFTGDYTATAGNAGRAAIDKQAGSIDDLATNPQSTLREPDKKIDHGQIWFRGTEANPLELTLRLAYSRMIYDESLYYSQGELALVVARLTWDFDDASEAPDAMEKKFYLSNGRVVKVTTKNLTKKTPLKKEYPGTSGVSLVERSRKLVTLARSQTDQSSVSMEPLEGLE